MYILYKNKYAIKFTQFTNKIKNKLTLAGGEVNGLLTNSKSTKDVINLNSTGRVAILLQLMSNETS